MKACVLNHPVPAQVIEEKGQPVEEETKPWGSGEVQLWRGGVGVEKVV